jgi:type I restriction enzyme R subunit
MDREVFRRRDLPHRDVPGAPYFVTTCLEGSIPARGLLDLTRFREELRQRQKPAHMTREEWEVRCWKQGFARLESWLDEQPARRVLESPALAEVVVDSLFHFAGERYDLLAYVVMPSHLHWLFQPLPEWVATLPEEDRRTPRERITYSLNRFTATKCNRILGVKGAFWQTESYDHWVRDVDELERIIRYIEENPVKAGLVQTPDEWRFSSAWGRKVTGTEWGVPLRKAMSGLES